MLRPLGFSPARRRGVGLLNKIEGTGRSLYIKVIGVGRFRLASKNVLSRPLPLQDLFSGASRMFWSWRGKCSAAAVLTLATGSEYLLKVRFKLSSNNSFLIYSQSICFSVKIILGGKYPSITHIEELSPIVELRALLFWFDVQGNISFIDSLPLQ